MGGDCLSGGVGEAGGGGRRGASFVAHPQEHPQGGHEPMKHLHW